METKSEMNFVKEKFFRDNPYPMPIEIGLPPFHTNLNFFHATIENELAETELIVKKIFTPYQNIDATIKWKDIEKSKQILQHLFVSSNKTIKEHKASCSRFKEKIVEKSQDMANLEDQLLNTKNEIKELKNVKTEMEKFVNEHSIYENFLKEVTQVSSEFKSVGDILNRYETLEHTRLECTRYMKEGLAETLLLRKEMSVLLDTRTSILKKLSNDLITMEGRRKRAKESLRYWENTVQKIKRKVEVKEEDRVDLGGACWDLYRAMCERRRVPPSAGVRDIKAQTDYIVKTIIFYKEVLAVATAVKQALQAYKPDSG